MLTDQSRTGELPPCGCAEPGTADPAYCYCGVEDLLQIIRRRYSLAVLNAIYARGNARYQDIATSVPRASSSTLSETLQALEAVRLITRTMTPDPGPHPSYGLTLAGGKLLSRLRRLLDEVQNKGG